MSSDAVKLARMQRQTAQLEAVSKILFNPVVELVGGMLLIDQIYPGAPAGSVVNRETVTVQGPLGIGAGLAILQTDGNGVSTYQGASKGDWARDTLKWVILAQQIAPALPGLAAAAGSVAGLLTKGVTK